MSQGIKNHKQHWDKVYSTKAEQEVSWFQPYPKTSMEFLKLFALDRNSNIIDIGGGDSHFADTLLDKGFENIWVLDISPIAIAKAKLRLGKRASRVNWIISDITSFKPSVQFDLWHDRAAFHFLTNRKNIEAYISIAEKSIAARGYMVLGTFSEQGPDKCSGLPVQKYSADDLTARFETSFDRIKCIMEDHTTPFNTVQNFLFCSFQRKK